MFTYKSRFLTRAEVWFDDEPGDLRKVDWVFYCYRSSPVPGAKSRPCHTYLIDLTRATEELQARLNSDTAYKIRRAREKDRITCESLDPADPAVIDDFQRMYNDFAPLKGLLPLDRGRLESMARAGALDISVAKDAQGDALVFHANVLNQSRASQMFLPSLYRKCADSAARNAIGRANRYLIWSDILRYKEQGLRAFDFGGWYTGTNSDMLKINDFKRGFGGEVVREYKCEHVLTAKGRLALAVASLLDRMKAVASDRKQPVEKPIYAKTEQCEISAPV